MAYMDYIEAGFRVFGLHPSSGGKCGCGNPECKAAYKHPIAANWQHTPDWSDEQLEVMEELGQFSTGFGVLVDGYLVIDIDPRNGGTVEQVQQYYDCAGFVVRTGGGGWHIYFKAPKDIPLVAHLDTFKGIDFKSNGYVVGAGSLHKSGQEYEVERGNPETITDAPQSLIDMLRKPDRYRARTSSGVVDVSTQDVAEVLSWINPDVDYDTWVRCGMAIHHTLNGGGFDIWDDWSSKGSKYSGSEQLERHWHSFGKSGNPVTYGTLIHYAEMAGYEQPVTFTYEVGAAAVVDILRPPGLVGEIAKWINDSALYKRENLAVAAALQAVGNIGGLRYVDERDGMTANLFTFCIAGSSTGKEHVQQRFADCMRAAGIVDAMHGAIKSEQEIIRNLTRHQAAFYSVDELGLVLRKIMGARNASYLEGVVGTIMSAYSKADSFMPVGGDVKEALKTELKNEIAALQRKIDENEDANGYCAARLAKVLTAMDNISNGIEKPFLSLIGYTTPVTFNGLMDFENATNGFLSRAMLFQEHDTNPKPQRPKCTKQMPMQLESQLAALYNMGSFGQDNGGRIEHHGEKTPIKTTSDANARLDDILIEFWQMAEDAKDTGLEAIPRRGYELCAKVSFILAIPEGVRTIEHVEWAFNLAKNDVQRKMRLAMANIEQDDAPVDSIAVKIQDLLSGSENGETQGVICNRCRPHKKDDVIKVLDELVKRGMVEATKEQHKYRKIEILRYKIK